MFIEAVGDSSMHASVATVACALILIPLVFLIIKSAVECVILPPPILYPHPFLRIFQSSGKDVCLLALGAITTVFIDPCVKKALPDDVLWAMMTLTTLFAFIIITIILDKVETRWMRAIGSCGLGLGPITFLTLVLISGYRLCSLTAIYGR